MMSQKGCRCRVRLKRSVSDEMGWRLEAYRIHWGFDVITLPGVRIPSPPTSAPPSESESESELAAACGL